MEFKTLYKRTKTGAIQYWGISIEEFDEHQATIIIKESGQLGTASPILHRETIHEGKQKRSPIEQAKAQAQSDWKKKHDEGYKSLEDLRIDELRFVNGVAQDSLTMEGGPVTLAMLLEEHLPKFNTDAEGNVKCMLATAIEKIKNVPYPAFAQPKSDGVRCLITIWWSHEDMGVEFLSRSGKTYTTLSHIERDLHEFIERNGGEGMLILDGEIYSDELTFQEIVAAVKKENPNSRKLKFHMYDIVNEENQEQRIKTYHELADAIGSDYIQPVETVIVTHFGDVKMHHNTWVQAGYEGAMIRISTGLYGQGQRSRDLIKVKEFDETEYPITHFEFGQRGVEDLIAVCQIDETISFKAKMQGTLAQKQALFNEWDINSDTRKERSIEFLGKLTVKHFGLTTDGIPRFPVGKAIRDYE